MFRIDWRFYITTSANHLPIYSFFRPTMDNSPLSNIPPELRTYIYEFCLISQPDPVIIKARGRPPATLQTCRQIRKECEGIYYATNTFLLEETSSNFFAKWLSVIGTENRKTLKEAIVEIEEGGAPQLHEQINRLRDIVASGSGIKALIVRLSYSSGYVHEGRKIELDVKNFGKSLREKIKELKKLLKEEGVGDKFMDLTYARRRLERLLELEEPDVVGEVERKRREDMKRALGISFN